MSFFNNHPSIQLIKDKYQQSFDFKFEFVSTKQLLKCVNEIDSNRDSGAEIIKMADIIPVYKKQSVNDKTNYRPMSFVPIISKI